MKTSEVNDMNDASNSRMPLFFLGHGSPMNALENNSFTQAF